MKLVKQKTAAQLAHQANTDARLDAIEEEVFVTNLTIVKASQAFRDVDATANPANPPQDFIDRAGGDVAEAQKDYRIAIAGWLPAKDAPIGVQNALKIVQNVMKFRNDRRVSREAAAAAPRPLAVQIIMGAPVPKGEGAQAAQVLVVEK